MADDKKPTGSGSHNRRCPGSHDDSHEPSRDRCADPLDSRLGQLEAAKARFDLGGHERVIGEALGTPPPGYGLTLVRAFVRDPRTLLVVWDINDEKAVAAIEELGLDRLALRVLDRSGAVLRKVNPAKRGGAYQLDLALPGATVQLDVGIVREDESFEVFARSSLVRMPPDAESVREATESIAIREEFDRRKLLRRDASLTSGHEADSRRSPASRLGRRLAKAESTERGDESGDDDSVGEPVRSVHRSTASHRATFRRFASDCSGSNWPGSPTRAFGGRFRE